MTYLLTAHAIERYRERCQRTLDRDRAKHELEQMMEVAEFRAGPPEWETDYRRDNDGFLILGDVALILKGRYVVTCIVKGSLRPSERRLRTRERLHRRRRAARMRGL